jgi:hypothetical protein
MIDSARRVSSVGFYRTSVWVISDRKLIILFVSWFICIYENTRGHVKNSQLIGEGKKREHVVRIAIT